MSGIYIPNWKKPESCDDCWAEYAYEICNSHSDSCPLISVPDHGDLIDRDMVLEKAWDIETFFDAVRFAPTIIPADKESDSDV